MKTLKSREIILTIAEEEGLTKQQVEDIITVNFEFVKYVQSQLVDRKAGYFPSVRLSNFGVFFVPDTVKDRMMKINNKNNESD